MEVESCRDGERARRVVFVVGGDAVETIPRLRRDTSTGGGIVVEDARDDVGAEGVEVRREVAVAEADGVRAVAVETREANLHRHRVYRGLAKATALVLERAEGARRKYSLSRSESSA